MADVREQILLRILAILNQVKPNGTYVFRNRVELGFEGATDELPAYVLLDGSEEAVVQSNRRNGPPLVVLTPEIYYGPKISEDRKNEGVGEFISTQRARMLKALFQDEELAMLLGDSGYIEYRGTETDLRIGDEVEGQFRLLFGFAYLLDVDDL